jgi:hypothetical protein
VLSRNSNRKKSITAAAIKDKFLGVKTPEHTLQQLVEYHNTTMKETLEWGTQKNYYTTQKYIQRFIAANSKLKSSFFLM